MSNTSFKTVYLCKQTRGWLIDRVCRLIGTDNRFLDWLSSKIHTDCLDLYAIISLYCKSPFVTLTKVNKSIVHWQFQHFLTLVNELWTNMNNQGMINIFIFFILYKIKTHFHGSVLFLMLVIKFRTILWVMLVFIQYL